LAGLEQHDHREDNGIDDDENENELKHGSVSAFLGGED
jgi:hypothetical protein